MTRSEAQMNDALNAGMANVVADHPAAVLLVDLDSGQVVYANQLATQLVPDVAMPVAIDDWSRSAGLQDSEGQALSFRSNSLRRVAAGDPLVGEIVTAKRRSDVSDAREDLWVIGMPLIDAPAPLDRRALVVFLPLRDQIGIDRLQQESFELQHRAVISSEVSFSISDPTAEDDPLLWVNPAFEAITGYRSADVIGTNCRFLQGPATDPAAIARIRDGLIAGGTVTETLLNYRADGTAFWNHIVISPIFDAAGKVTHHVGVQSDVTVRVAADIERDRALALAGTANRRLAALAAVSAELANGLDTGEATLARLPSVVAAHFGGWVLAAGVERHDRSSITQIGVAHSDAAVHETHAEAVGTAVSEWAQSSAGREWLARSTAHLAISGAQHWTLGMDRLRVLAANLGLPASSLSGGTTAQLIVAPLTARGQQIGLIGLLRIGATESFDAADVTAMADLGVRAGVALDNARLYAREHAAALTLQRSLLPKLPILTGFEVAATYQPAHNQAEVGGDWYDVLELPDSAGIGVAIGDVMGHDLRAAAAMGQLRSVLRSYAWSGDEPSAVIARLDELVQGLGMAALATCAYAIVCPHDDGNCSVVYTLAGHPPPMIMHPDRRVERLDASLTTPIGVRGGTTAVPQATVELPADGYLVMYTDGLIERRDSAIDEGVDRLEATIARAPAGASAEQLCQHIVSELTSNDHDDDICVLVLRRLPLAGSR